MSSVLAAPQQIPSRVSFFKVSGVGGATTSRFIFNPINFASLTGFVTQNGNEVFFSTFANAVTALTTAISAPNAGANAALVDGQILRDMGKSFTILVSGTVPLRVAVISKVAKYGVNGENSEGVIGSSAANAVAAANYNTGYVVTWTANPSSIPCSVTRTGY